MKYHDLPIIECEVTFLPKSEGGRSCIPSLNDERYRPHVVVGDPKQRKAITKTAMIEVEGADGIKRSIPHKNVGDEEYLGVAFHAGPPEFEMSENALGLPFLVKLRLMFWPAKEYEKLQPGATFTVREGARVVGYGTVINTPPDLKKSSQ